MNDRNEERAALQVPPDLTIVAIGGCGKRLASEICGLFGNLRGTYLPAKSSK